MNELVPSTGGLPDEKYAREILRRLPKGYSIAFAFRPGGDEQAARRVGCHPYLFDPDGMIVRLPDGAPVTVAGTPGSTRAIKKDLSKCRRAGVKVR